MKKNRPILPTLALFLALTLANSAAFAGAVAKQVTGIVEVGKGEPPHWSILAAGDEIAPNDRIRTGSDGRVEIALNAGTVRVHENSMLRLPPPEGDADRVALEKGNSLFDVLRRAGRRFEVHTPTVVVSVKGTRFGVDARGVVGEVAVYRGTVGVRRADVPDALETLVREGFLAASLPGVPIDLDVVPAGDPWSKWQDFGVGRDEGLEVPAKLNDVSRAKDSMRRKTDADVLDRAVQRRPEIAERIRKLNEQKAKTGNFPAALLEGSDDARRSRETRLEGDISTGLAKELRDTTADSMRAARDQLGDLTNAEDSLIPRILGLEDGGGLIGSTAGELIEGLALLNQEFGVGLVPTVVNALEEAGQTLNGTGTAFTEVELLQKVETLLVGDGMDPTLAGQVVQSLLNN